MITDGTSNWYYLAIKRISGLLRGITSNHNGDFYRLNCLHSYRAKSKLKKHEKICKNHDFCHLKMPDVNNNILESKPGKKSLTHPFIIYADLQCLLSKMNSSVKWSDPGHFLESQGKFFSSFPCTLFFHVFDI